MHTNISKRFFKYLNFIFISGTTHNTASIQAPGHYIFITVTCYRVKYRKRFLKRYKNFHTSNASPKLRTQGWCEMRACVACIALMSALICYCSTMLVLYVHTALRGLECDLLRSALACPMYFLSVIYCMYVLCKTKGGRN